MHTDLIPLAQADDLFCRIVLPAPVATQLGINPEMNESAKFGATKPLAALIGIATALP
jgi:hypothetical protein